MSRHASLARAALAALAAACAAGAGAACFSERTTTGPIASGECRIPLDATTAGATVVFIRDFAFHPQTVTVPAGGRIVWVNCDDPGSDAHTATSDGPEWDSGLLQPGATYGRTLDETGSFPYHCEPHPSMTATVTVE